MSFTRSTPTTVFLDRQQVAAGPLAEVAAQTQALFLQNPSAALLVFSDENGRVIDVDFRGSVEEVTTRLPEAPATEAPPAKEEKSRGRPRLGVVAREVTLLPRHWEWLASQPGGASVALRKLVEDARRVNQAVDQRRQVQEAAYRFMSAMAGDEAGFEDAARALFAAREDAFVAAQASWPEDVRRHAQRLAAPVFAAS